MKSPKKIFISFKTEERDKAFVLKEAIEKEGFSVWWQENLQCGQEWHREIDKALADAGAVIVLWSNKSYSSQWVRHEASQSIAKGTYTPVRIEVMNIENIFGRIQATDIINWNGESNHPGFQNLITRLKELMPPELSLWEKSLRFISKYFIVIISSLIAAFAIYLLLNQRFSLNKQLKSSQEQIDKQQEILKSLNLQKNALDSQIQIQQSTSAVLDTASKNQKDQVNQLNKLLAKTESQSDILTNQTNSMKDALINLDSVKKNLLSIRFPLDSLSLKVSLFDSIPINKLRYRAITFFFFKKTKTSVYEVADSLTKVVGRQLYVSETDEYLDFFDSLFYHFSVFFDEDDLVIDYKNDKTDVTIKNFIQYSKKDKSNIHNILDLSNTLIVAHVPGASDLINYDIISVKLNINNKNIHLRGISSFYDNKSFFVVEFTEDQIYEQF